MDTGGESESGGVMAVAGRLATSLEALAALAAHVRVEDEGLDVEPEVRRLLAALAAEVVGDTGAAPPVARQAVVGMARAFLRQAEELVEDPGRASGWDRADPALLQGLGRLSGAIVEAVRAAEGVLDGLGERLAAPGARVLDVGTGTGWLAIGLARAYPQAHVVGIDVFEPALELARANVAEAGLGDRVELRRQDAASLDEPDAYDAVWLPLPFIPADTVPALLDACGRALRRGGWLLPGTFAGPPGRVPELLVALRTVRAGGHPWAPDELVAHLAAEGWPAPRQVPRTWTAPVHLYATRRP